MQSVLSLVLFLLFLLYILLTEALDWHGRAELLKEKYPRLSKFLLSRLARLVLLAVSLTYLAKDYRDSQAVAPPPVVNLAPPEIKVQSSTLVPVPPEKRCWVSQHFGLPNSKVPGSVSTTAAIIRCNYTIAAPFTVQVEFDRDFIPGAIVFPDSGMINFSGGQGPGTQGRIYRSPQITSPSLVANYLAIVTVYGTTDQYPRALKANIETAK